MKDSPVFIDTNVFLYAILEDDKHRVKRERAINLLQSLTEKDVLISTQVLNEIYSIMLRNGIEDRDIQNKLSIIIKETNVTLTRLKTIRLSWDIRLKYRFSYWDSLILASALENDCKLLYTEDMQDGQTIDVKLKIVNPFLH